jgi:hypothetical protein
VVREALLQAFALYQGLPLMDREQIAPLLTFLLGAVMEDVTDPRITSNQSGWCDKYPGETEAFRACYYELLAHRAPIRASPPMVDAGGAPPFAPAFPLLCQQIASDNWRTCIRFGSNPDGQSSSESNKYNQYKLIILVGICGAPGDPSTWCNLSLDALPDFWTKIWGMRGCNSRLQAFVEGYIADCPKASPWEYRFLLTMEMLTTIPNLSFSGDDPDKLWQSQMKGMSIWSLTPQNESTHGEAIE